MNKQSQNIYDLASWFLDKEPMSHKKLQKLCYYAVAWSYALLDKSIVNDSEFEAWVHGPVSKSLWSTYATYGWDTINKKTERWKKLNQNKLNRESFSSDILDLLESVWTTYGGKSGLELEALSHKECPWLNARKGLQDFARSTEKISSIDMKSYYLSIYNN